MLKTIDETWHHVHRRQRLEQMNMKREVFLEPLRIVLIKMQSDGLLGGCGTRLVISKHLNRQSLWLYKRENATHSHSLLSLFLLSLLL